MNRVIAWIISTIILFFILDRVGGAICQYLVNNSQFRYSRLYTEKAACDLLFVGNSRGLIFYQPVIEELTGKKTFNLSYNGLPIDLALALVKDYLDLYPAPEKIIIDVTLLDRKNPQLVNGFQAYRKHSDRLDSLIHRSDPYSYYAGLLSHLYRFNSEVFYRTLVYQSKDDTDWLMDRTINDNLVKGVEAVEEVQFEVKQELVSELKALITIAQKNEIEVTLLVNPYFKPYIRQMHSFDPWLDQLEQIIGMEIIDFSQAFKDKKGIGDYLHLNKYGAERYLQLLHQEGIFN